MAKSAVPPTAMDDEVRALLVRYWCPVPFHEVRTRFLGNIASPGMEVSPIKVVEGLWGGKLPEFETIDAANELVGALVMGLWNRLSRHQDRNAPFRLTRIETNLSIQKSPQCVKQWGFCHSTFLFTTGHGKCGRSASGRVLEG